MSATVSITDAQILTVLRALLTDILPSSVEVIAGQDNRVPEPSSPDFVTMTTTLRVRLETNIVSYADPYPTLGSVRMAMQPTQVTVQVDIHGPDGGENAQIVTTLLRDDYACRSFAASGVDMAPLYTSEPRQVPFINAEAQYETRWSIDFVLQVNPVVTTAQSFASDARAGLINVDRVYPPGVAE